MDMILDKCIFQNRFLIVSNSIIIDSLLSVTYVVSTHWNCLIEAISICTYNIYVNSIN